MTTPPTTPPTTSTSSNGPTLHGLLVLMVDDPGRPEGRERMVSADLRLAFPASDGTTAVTCSLRRLRRGPDGPTVQTSTTDPAAVAFVVDVLASIGIAVRRPTV